MQHDEDHLQALCYSRQLVNLENPSDHGEENYKQLKAELANYLDRLIIEDFNKLIAILYRIDISEEKASAALAANSDKESAGETLARLLIERQLQKIKFRRNYSQR